MYLFFAVVFAYLTKDIVACPVSVADQSVSLNGNYFATSSSSNKNCQYDDGNRVRNGYCVDSVDFGDLCCKKRGSYSGFLQGGYNDDMSLTFNIHDFAYPIPYELGTVTFTGSQQTIDTMRFNNGVIDETVDFEALEDYGDYVRFTGTWNSGADRMSVYFEQLSGYPQKYMIVTVAFQDSPPLQPGLIYANGVVDQFDLVVDGESGNTVTSDLDDPSNPLFPDFSQMEILTNDGPLYYNLETANEEDYECQKNPTSTTHKAVFDMSDADCFWKCYSE